MKAFGADYFITADVQSSSDVHKVRLTKTPVKQGGGEPQVHEEEVSTNDVQLSTSMRAAAVSLLAPQHYVGGLEVQCNVKSGAVWLGSRQLVACPNSATIHDLTPGAATVMHQDGDHSVRIDPAIRFDRVTVVQVLDSATGPVMRVVDDTKALPANESIRVVENATNGGAISPLLIAGAGVAVVGLLLALLSAGAAFTGGALTIMWPKQTTSTGLRLFKLFPQEPVPLVIARFGGGLALVPAGMVVTLVGAAVVVVGVVAAAAGVMGVGATKE
jgi:hypothetical protein